MSAALTVVAAVLLFGAGAAFISASVHERPHIPIVDATMAALGGLMIAVGTALLLFNT